MISKKTVGNREVFCHEIPSIDALIEAAATPPGKHPGDRSLDSGSRFSSVGEGDHYAKNSWTFGASWEDSIGLLSNGWTEKTPEFEMIADRISGAFDGAGSTEYRYDVCGDEIDIAAYFEGDPEYMIDPKPTGEKQINLLIDCSYVCFVEGDYILRRGAAIYAVARHLEKSGYNVGITAVIQVLGGDSEKEGFLGRYLIKHPSEYMDAGRLAFVLAHPAMYRRIVFRLMEQLHKDGGDPYCKAYSGYGYFGPGREFIEDSDLEFGDVVVPAMDNSTYRDLFGTEKDALSTILKNFQRAGVQVFEE